MDETDNDFVATEKYCRKKGNQPIPVSEISRLSEILRNAFRKHRKGGRCLTTYLKIVLLIAIAIGMFLLAKSWISLFFA